MQMQKRLSNWQKLNYAMGDFSSNIMFAAVSFYLLYFMINVGGLNPFYAAAIFIIVQVWDAVTDYLMGIICDCTVCRYGSMRVYMLWGALPFGLLFPLLWVVPGATTQLYKFLYYLIIYCLYCTIWTMVYIPYNSLLANITNDYDERTSLNGWRVLIANVGMIFGAALFPMFAEGEQSIFYCIFGSEKAAYFFSSLLFGLLGGVLMLVCALNVKELPRPPQKKRISPMKTLKEFFAMREFRNTLLHYVLAMAGVDVVMGIYMFYLADCLAITDSVQLMFFLGLPFLAAIFSSMIWVKLAQRYSKHRVYAAAIVGSILGQFSTLFIPEKGYVPLTIFCIYSGFFMAATQILPFASIPDVVEADEFYNGVRREGSYFGVVQFAYNAASGIAMALVSFILGVFGYVENGTVSQMVGFVQPESALLAIRGIFAFLTTAMFVLSVAFSARANMGRERFNAMKQEIAQRKTP